ncbi:MAG: efflux system, rane fusion protein CmeA [Steroidobacteraceae bacterium]|jgi:membrane fusion protein (multidrug efflux system)|nr:efflux system, rane fusion protein CmeA [Steroidobacteraceae bacterium]
MPVGVLTVQSQPVPIVREASGRLAPTRASDVRARVPGVLQKRLYKEGSMVKEGEPLVLIDTAPYRAALAQATAQLEQAEASATNAKVAADRNRELARQNLVSRMQLDDAEALERTSAAQVSAARAQVQTARINLGYATITAPISGRATQMRVLEGALVGQGEATLITTVEQIDTLFVFFDQPATDFERLQRASASGTVTLAQGNLATIRLKRPDGTPYEETGTLDFSDYSVNPTTGSVAFRGKVANPNRTLLPGLYVGVELTAGTLNKGFKVPQLAVLRDGQGPYVLVAGADGNAVQKRVETISVVGNDWIISNGLADGDQVIVDHLQMVQPGMPVAAQPANAAPAAPGGAPAAPAAPGGAPAAADAPAEAAPADAGAEQGKPAAEATH